MHCLAGYEVDNYVEYARRKNSFENFSHARTIAIGSATVKLSTFFEHGFGFALDLIEPYLRSQRRAQRLTER